MGKYSEAFIAFDVAKKKHAMAIAEGGGEVRFLGAVETKIGNHEIGFDGGLIEANDYVVIVVGSGGRRDDLERSWNTGGALPSRSRRRSGRRVEVFFLRRLYSAISCPPLPCRSRRRDVDAASLGLKNTTLNIG
jgi:hypothetical protein